jgi:hypothetical protein
VEPFLLAVAAGILACLLIVGWGVVHNKSILRQLLTIVVGLIVGLAVTVAVGYLVLIALWSQTRGI